jgi:hypothetical protein
VLKVPRDRFLKSSVQPRTVTLEALTNEPKERVHRGKFAFGPDFNREKGIWCEQGSPTHTKHVENVDWVACARAPEQLFAAPARAKCRVGRHEPGQLFPVILEQSDPVFALQLDFLFGGRKVDATLATC